MKTPFLLIFTLLACLPLSATAQTTTPSTVQATNWNEEEKIATSLEKLLCHSSALGNSYLAQLQDGRGSAEGIREKILYQTVLALHEAVECLKKRFFQAADPAELAERVANVQRLTERARGAADRVSLYGNVRQNLAKFENELDWLKKLTGTSGNGQTYIPVGY